MYPDASPHAKLVPLKGHRYILNATEGLELEPYLHCSMTSSKNMAAYSCPRLCKGLALGAGGSRRVSNSAPSPDGELCPQTQLRPQTMCWSCMSCSSRYTHPSGSNMGQGKDIVLEMCAVTLNSEGLHICFAKFSGHTCRHWWLGWHKRQSWRHQQISPQAPHHPSHSPSSQGHRWGWDPSSQEPGCERGAADPPPPRASQQDHTGPRCPHQRACCSPQCQCLLNNRDL